MTEPNERVKAIELANRILDRPSGDPDDDLAVLARHLVRATDLSRDAIAELIRPYIAANRTGYAGSAADAIVKAINAGAVPNRLDALLKKLEALRLSISAGVPPLYRWEIANELDAIIKIFK